MWQIYAFVSVLAGLVLMTIKHGILGLVGMTSWLFVLLVLFPMWLDRNQRNSDTSKICSAGDGERPTNK